MNTNVRDRAWWRDVLDRAWRQGYQVLLPVFALAIQGSISGVNWGSTLASIVVAFLVVILRAVTGLRVDSRESLPLQAVDRAVSAAAATFLALMTADRFDLLNADFGAMLVAALGSIGLALGSTLISPPPVHMVEEIDPDETNDVL